MAQAVRPIDVHGGGRFGAAFTHRSGGFVPQGSTSVWTVGEGHQVQEHFRKDDTDIWDLVDATVVEAVRPQPVNGFRYGVSAVQRIRPRNRLDLFYLNSEGACQHSWRNEDRSELPQQENLGGRFEEGCNAVAMEPGNSNSRLDVFALGSDRVVYQKTFDGTRWANTWNSLGMAGVNSTNLMRFPPVVVSSGPSRIDVFMRAPTETHPDGPGSHPYSVFHKYFDGTSWFPSAQGWNELGGNPWHRISVVSARPGHLMLATSSGDDSGYGCHTRTLSGNNWGPWEGHLIIDHPELLAWEGKVTLVGTRRQSGLRDHMIERTWDNGSWGVERRVDLNEGAWQLLGLQYNPVEWKRYFYVWNKSWFIEYGRLWS